MIRKPKKIAELNSIIVFHSGFDRQGIWRIPLYTSRRLRFSGASDLNKDPGSRVPFGPRRYSRRNKVHHLRAATARNRMRHRKASSWEPKKIVRFHAILEGRGE